MSSRERVSTVLDYREADRVPMDFGSTAVTGIQVTCVAALRKHYGLADHPVSVIEPYQMLGAVESDLRDALGIDTASVLPPGNLFGFRNERCQEWRALGTGTAGAGRFRHEAGPRRRSAHLSRRRHHRGNQRSSTGDRFLL